jgi:hypothetical protein
MLCTTCSKYAKCNTPCNKVENDVLKECNGISTRRNKEYRLTDFADEIYSVKKYLNWLHNVDTRNKVERDKQRHAVWNEIIVVIDTNLTHKQKVYIMLYLEGNTFAAIGRIFSISGGAIRYAIYGDPRNGGGAVRKIQIALGIVDK